MNRQHLQWAVFVAEGEPGAGEEIPAQTPVLVVSRESANEALPMVTVLPLIRMKAGRRIYPNETLLPAGAAGIDTPAVLMAHLITTVRKSRLSTRLGSVEDPGIRAAVQNAVRIQLDLDGGTFHEHGHATR